MQTDDQPLSDIQCCLAITTEVKSQYVDDIATRDKMIKPNVNPQFLSYYDQLQSILVEHRDVVYNLRLGCARGFWHSIETNGKPVTERLRPVNDPAKRDGINQSIDKLLHEGVIECGDRDNSSNVTMVKKSDGSWRMCIDYRKLNETTVRDIYPLPNIPVILEAMSTGTIFTKLDLSQGFHQLLVYPPDRYKTGFICHRGLFHYVRMPFGLVNAPS